MFILHVGLKRYERADRLHSARSKLRLGRFEMLGARDITCRHKAEDISHTIDRLEERGEGALDDLPVCPLFPVRVCVCV